MKCQSIRITRRQVGDREFDSIRIVINDLHLSADLVDDRQIRSAKKLSDEHQCWFMYDDHNAERVRNALGIKPGFSVDFDEQCMKKELGMEK